MSLAQLRGGVPLVFLDTIDTTGRKHRFPATIWHMIARNQGAFPVRVYFTEADYTAGINYVTLPVAAATAPHGEWVGPVEAIEIWLRGIGGSAAVEVVGFQRRG